MSVHPNPGIRTDLRLAMLVDGENASWKTLGEVLEEASKYGTVNIRRVYGDWTTPSMSKWRDVVERHAFQTPNEMQHSTGKNAADIFLAMDAMEILHSGRVDGFCIVSSDGDFTVLAKRMRENGMFVLGIGRKATPTPFKKACERFTYVENLVDESKEEDPVEAEEQASPDDWKAIITKAIRMGGDEEWAALSLVGNNARKIDPSFDSRTYGEKKLLSLVQSAPREFNLRKDESGGHAPIYHVRVAQAADGT